MVEAIVENIRETFRHISTKQVVDIVALLADQPLEGVPGRRPLHRPDRPLHGRAPDDHPAQRLPSDGQESNWRDRLIDMGKRDVLVIFDIRRYQESLVRFAEKAHQRGVQIVLFTDQWLSPIARFARHVIAGRTAVPSPWDSSAALFVVAETLIGELTRQLEADSARRIREMENLRQP